MVPPPPKPTPGAPRLLDTDCLDLQHDGDRAGFLDRDRVVHGLLGAIASALDAETAEAVDALRGEPDVSHHRYACEIGRASCRERVSSPV